MSAGPFEWEGYGRSDKVHFYLQDDSFTVQEKDGTRTIRYSEIKAVYYELFAVLSGTTLFFTVEVVDRKPVELTCTDYRNYRDQCRSGSISFFEYYGRAVPDGVVYNKMRFPTALKWGLTTVLVGGAAIFYLIDISPEERELLLRGDWQAYLEFGFFMLVIIGASWWVIRTPRKRSAEYILDRI